MSIFFRFKEPFIYIYSRVYPNFPTFDNYPEHLLCWQKFHWAQREHFTLMWMSPIGKHPSISLNDSPVDHDT